MGTLSGNCKRACSVYVSRSFTFQGHVDALRTAMYPIKHTAERKVAVSSGSRASRAPPPIAFVPGVLVFVPARVSVSPSSTASSVTYRVRPLQLKHISELATTHASQHLGVELVFHDSIQAIQQSIAACGHDTVSVTAARSRWWREPGFTLLALHTWVLSTLMQCRCHRF